MIPTQDEKRFPDALRCNHCGKIVERGIFRVVEHLDKCGGNLNDIETNVYDAEFEIIEQAKIATGNEYPTKTDFDLQPKQLTNEKE